VARVAGCGHDRAVLRLLTTDEHRCACARAAPAAVEEGRRLCGHLRKDGPASRSPLAAQGADADDFPILCAPCFTSEKPDRENHATLVETSNASPARACLPARCPSRTPSHAAYSASGWARSTHQGLDARRHAIDWPPGPAIGCTSITPQAQRSPSGRTSVYAITLRHGKDRGERSPSRRSGRMTIVW